MSNGYFLGGIATGITTLTAMAIYSDKESTEKTDANSTNTFSVEDIENMSADKILMHLSTYQLRSLKYAIKFTFKTSVKKLDCGYYEIFDKKSPIGMAKSFIYKKAIACNRYFYKDDIIKYYLQQAKLYEKYKPIFKRGNKILLDKGIPCEHMNHSWQGKLLSCLDNSLGNEQWLSDAIHLEETVEEWRNRICDMATALSEKLLKI